MTPQYLNTNNWFSTRISQITRILLIVFFKKIRVIRVICEIRVEN
jgi:hypothetical protein